MAMILAPAVALLLVPGALAAPGAGPSPEGSWPLRPRPDLVTGFHPPDAPWGAGHRGVDLAGSVGQPVRSALPGTVSFAGVIAGRGVVVVDHGTTRTTYQPVVAQVRVGARVDEGERLGSLALFGSHCFPRACLHWGLLRGETYLDPLTLVGAAPVRLLPLFGPLPGLTGERGSVPQLPGWQPNGAQLFRLTRGDAPAGTPAGAGRW